MRLSQLQDFIAVAESGSIRAGAKVRDVSAPAITKSIRQLEEELHVPLLTRTTRGVVLSRFGDAFLRRARLIATEARKATDEMTQMLGTRNGTVRIGATGGPANLLLPAVLKRFRTQHPDVQVCIDSGVYPEHLADLRAGVMDMAVSPIPDEGIEREFVCETLYHNDSVVVAHQEHPLRHARTLRELVNSDWVLTGRRMQGPGAAILDAFRALDLPLPRVAVRCDTIGMIQTLLQDRSLLCLLPRQLVPGRLATAGLVALPIEDPLPSHAVSLIYRADSPMTPVAEQFATLLRREVHYMSKMPDSPLRRQVPHPAPAARATPAPIAPIAPMAAG
ncbi:transcriptional regulator, LysR family [Cupriavidus sp. OV038]|jgi:DNA-binding transcriptional LysR family regulator|uniref:LysR family transcriptional regulator n=1 Tax=unclassified Cupriavidus TaxID=2640874 RepID=UPI0008F30A2E|nr:MULTISPECIES: LysR family transcriptional regulator [unclassified Cupriavidus]SFC96275.1 transcriptional regulator, LysR family [Cupriavidus sp. OV038]SFP65132.1 transcriptional regulator, LysR family [Cupriavidus sp. OV096]